MFSSWSRRQHEFAAAANFIVGEPIPQCKKKKCDDFLFITDVITMSDNLRLLNVITCGHFMPH